MGEDDDGKEDGEDGEEGEEGEQQETGEEEEKEEDEEVEVMVESESTKKKKKEEAQREKARDAALTKLPYVLPDKGPMYKGTASESRDEPQKSTQWTSKGGPIPKTQDVSSIDHKDNRAFENIRAHQISSIFCLQKHLVDCEKGALERNSTPGPLRGPGGEYSPCKTEMAVSQADDGRWFYEYSELPGLVSNEIWDEIVRYNRADPI